MKVTEHDPGLYHDLLRSFDSRKSMDEAFEKFFEDFAALRKKYKIPDVVIIMSARALVDEKSCEFFVQFHMGNANNSIPLIAQALGRARGDMDAMIAELRDPRRD